MVALSHFVSQQSIDNITESEMKVCSLERIRRPSLKCACRKRKSKEGACAEELLFLCHAGCTRVVSSHQQEVKNHAHFLRTSKSFEILKDV